MEKIKPFQIYRHFKGNLYQIICIAENSEDGTKEVIYRALYDENKIYSRKLDMFLSDVDGSKYPDVSQSKRFELVEYVDATKHTEIKNNPITVVKVENGDEKKTEKAEAVTKAPVVPETPKKSEKPEEKASSPDSKINPVLLKFLDAQGYEAQLECLSEIKEDLTEEILIPIELSLGMEEQKGSIDQRYRGIKNYICLKQRYEKTTRL